MAPGATGGGSAGGVGPDNGAASSHSRRKSLSDSHDASLASFSLMNKVGGLRAAVDSKVTEARAEMQRRLGGMSVGGDSLPLPGVTTFTAMARRSAKPVVDTVARLTPDDNALLNRVRTGVARGVSGMKRSSTLTDLPSANTRRGGENEVSGASNGFGHDESGVVSGPWAGPGVLPTIWNFAHMPPMPATPPMPLIPAADKTPTTPE
eukprot:CAMPEP_0181350314 /NCGR_PEP_ID=MMETSP1106-20121128/1198_1 /TAXON_ID=81844 /ORGANISM="Mantoniella antarctica, Strain SL-175" /LENGTH=206 /DNA_ID=CAMNT_0023462775 /DNA_START=91 /DNA_END=708 /DNA_ORIENTATION=+